MNHFKEIDTPVGRLKLIATGIGLAAILWEHDKPGRVKIDWGDLDESDPVLIEAETQLAEYFAKKRTTFDLPLDFIGTDFQRKVWAELLKIPFGETRTYGAIANELGDSNAVRAVGAANGKNPISIIAPCHRVIGASGKLTGFAGGLQNKDFLLRLERSGKTPTLWD
ncbi:MAG TPA: methylated-DNA--[protein]-cysteine S-methyltransferase [Dyadobacter sp.]|jgi:methylated-DNA-[protein]-cysteine S-methyltransferase|nr:methylated-DNA--[protein]-cysteine S-methyltransferase [Dyadobacter sp.]